MPSDIILTRDGLEKFRDASLELWADGMSFVVQFADAEPKTREDAAKILFRAEYLLLFLRETAGIWENIADKTNVDDYVRAAIDYSLPEVHVAGFSYESAHDAAFALASLITILFDELLRGRDDLERCQCLVRELNKWLPIDDLTVRIGREFHVAERHLSETASGQKTDTLRTPRKKLSPPKMPQHPDARDLYAELMRERPKGKSDAEIARTFLKSCTAAQIESHLKSVRRYEKKLAEFNGNQ